MSDKYYGEKDSSLLKQLEHILDCDPLIDEVGFIHPTQFETLNKETGVPFILSTPQAPVTSVNSETPGVEAPNNNDMVFWFKNHKLGISTKALLPLYNAAKHEFMTAYRHYKTFPFVPLKNHKFVEEDSPCSLSSSQRILEAEVMKHSKTLLLLSCDFGTAWNSRKLVISKKRDFSMLLDELFLSSLVLSYSPKSDHAWTHRRWVIKLIAEKCSNLQDIVGKESELVETIAEKYKMNYRAWSHRCWIVSFMTIEQVLPELKKSRGWAALHVADNCCFHYRRRLLVRILEGLFQKQNRGASSSCNTEILSTWKEELDWNEMLLKRYIGREALWLHRRFLSLYWIKHFATDLCGEPSYSKDNTRAYCNIDAFIDNELAILGCCSNMMDNGLKISKHNGRCLLLIFYG